jgi:hypothetical protein
VIDWICENYRNYEQDLSFAACKLQSRTIISFRVVNVVVNQQGNQIYQTTTGTQGHFIFRANNDLETVSIIPCGYALRAIYVFPFC